MRTLLAKSCVLTTLLSLCLGASGFVARGGQDPASTLWTGPACCSIDSPWVVQIPTGSADFLNTGFMVKKGLDDSFYVLEGLPVTGVAVSTADFGSGRTFPVAGVFLPNLGLDPSGWTPDLAGPIIAVHDPPLGTPATYDYLPFMTGEAAIPPGTKIVHAVVQLPPGDPGLLAVGGDATDYQPSSYTNDGYATHARGLWAYLGLSIGQDNSTTSSCKPADRAPHGRLRVSAPKSPTSSGAGDQHGTAVIPGQMLEIVFFGSHVGDLLRFYATPGYACTGLLPLGPVLKTLPDPDGDGSYLRVRVPWPGGVDSLTLAAAWGNPACSNPGAGLTNCVSVGTTTRGDLALCDDGTIESGWVVQIPSGSSDYFNVDFGDPYSLNGVGGITMSVFDFVTATPQFPAAGVANANYAVDASGHTPDLGAGVLGVIAPFTFPAGIVATTSTAYITHRLVAHVPDPALGDHVHAWVQFPPGDSGLLGIGGDSSGFGSCSYLSSNGYATPATGLTFVNWGNRISD